MDSLKVLKRHIFFPFLDFGQAFKSNGLLIRVEVLLLKIFQGGHSGGQFMGANMLSPIELTKGHLSFSKNKKPYSSNATTSIWMRFVPSNTSHKESKAGLSSAYFLLVLPTQCIRSSWQNPNLCNSIDTPLVTYQ